ncbi:MAG: cytochrome c biogenesis protein CcsA [Gammaproteobacteria bacterium]|nr:cytochrome c biogenesis protein CcsA [Gammaproteobacteria bacterium]
MTSTITVFIAIFAYLGSGIVIALRLFRGPGESNLPRIAGLGLGFFGLIAHAALLFEQIISEGGINLGFFGASSLIAWTILLLLLLSSLSKHVENLGILILPLAALSVYLDQHFHSDLLLPGDAPWGLRIHVIVSLLAYSLLALASVQAVLLSIQDHQLHNRHPGGFIRALPPLQTMEKLLFEMIAMGFALLTLALLSGFMFLNDMFAQHIAHKTILSIIAWFVFGTLLWGRFKYGWRGQKALTWTLVGFVVLMLGYFGSKFVLELVLGS